MATLLFLSLLPWIFAVIVPAALLQPLDWYSSHRSGQLTSTVNYLVVILKFHPLCYIHVFVFGMVLSVFRFRVRERRDLLAVWPMRCGATVGYLGLLLVFLVPALRPVAHKLSARLSVLMPLQGMVLLGLSPLAAPPASAHVQPSSILWIGCSWAADPVARLFANVPEFFGDVSYSQYLLQWIVYDVWPVASLSGLDLIALFVLLVCLAMLTVIIVLRPAKDWWMRQRQQPAKTLLLPMATLVILVVVGLVWEHGLRPRKNQNPKACAPPRNVSKAVPAYVRIAHDAVDVRLNWTSDACARALINPSLLVTKDGTFVRAAREHELVFSTTNATWRARHAMQYKDPELGQTRQVQAGEEVSVTEETMLWKSAIVMSGSPLTSAPRDVFELANKLDGDGAPLRVANLTSNLRSMSPWGGDLAPLCEPKPVYDVKNNTLSRIKVLGAEDPKIFFNPSSSGETFGEWALAFSSLPPQEHRPGCQDKGEAVKQMYVAVSASKQTASKPAAPVRIDCGFTRRHEKNWIAFWRGSQLHFVYSLYPHTVVLVRPSDGACAERWSTSTFTPMMRLAQSASGLRLHGSATATRYGSGYVALLHVLDSSRRYATLAYTFEGQPPFTPTAISRPLPLTMPAHAFASGLLLHPPASAADKTGSQEAPEMVVVSYGLADEESRALVMSNDFFMALFICGSFEGFPLSQSDLMKD